MSLYRLFQMISARGIVFRLGGWLFVMSCVSLFAPLTVYSLPPADDLPEEVMRNQTVLGARSPVDNQPLTPSEYEQLQVELAEDDTPPKLSPKLERLVFLLKLRKFYRSLWPF